MKRILNWNEACEYSGLTEKQLKKAVQDGKLKAYWKDERSYGPTADTLDAFLSTRVVDPRLLKRI